MNSRLARCILALGLLLPAPGLAAPALPSDLRPACAGGVELDVEPYKYSDYKAYLYACPGDGPQPFVILAKDGGSWRRAYAGEATRTLQEDFLRTSWESVFYEIRSSEGTWRYAEPQEGRVGIWLDHGERPRLELLIEDSQVVGVTTWLAEHFVGSERPSDRIRFELQDGSYVSTPKEAGGSVRAVEDRTGVVLWSCGYTRTAEGKLALHGAFEAYDERSGEIRRTGHFSHGVASGEWVDVEAGVAAPATDLQAGYLEALREKQARRCDDPQCLELVVASQPDFEDCRTETWVRPLNDRTVSQLRGSRFPLTHVDRGYARTCEEDGRVTRQRIWDADGRVWFDDHCSLDHPEGPGGSTCRVEVALGDVRGVEWMTFDEVPVGVWRYTDALGQPTFAVAYEGWGAVACDGLCEGELERLERLSQDQLAALDAVYRADLARVEAEAGARRRAAEAAAYAAGAARADAQRQQRYQRDLAVFVMSKYLEMKSGVFPDASTREDLGKRVDNDIRLYGHPAELSGTLSDPGYRQFVGFDTRTLIPCIYEASACPVAEFGDAFELAEQASTAATDALVEGLERQVEVLRRVLARADAEENAMLELRLQTLEGLLDVGASDEGGSLRGAAAQAAEALACPGLLDASEGVDLERADQTTLLGLLATCEGLDREAMARLEARSRSALGGGDVLTVAQAGGACAEPRVSPQGSTATLYEHGRVGAPARRGPHTGPVACLSAYEAPFATSQGVLLCESAAGQITTPTCPVASGRVVIATAAGAESCELSCGAIVAGTCHDVQGNHPRCESSRVGATPP